MPRAKQVMVQVIPGVYSGDRKLGEKLLRDLVQLLARYGGGIDTQ